MKLPLAPIIWKAAHKYLRVTETYKPNGSVLGHTYSCMAILEALYCTSKYEKGRDQVSELLVSCGLKSPLRNFNAFSEFSDEKKQEARYLWLLFLYQMCEDENITIEV